MTKKDLLKRIRTIKGIEIHHEVWLDTGVFTWKFHLLHDVISLYNETKGCSITCLDCEVDVILPKLRTWDGTTLPDIEFSSIPWEKGRLIQNQNCVSIDAGLAMAFHLMDVPVIWFRERTDCSIYSHQDILQAIQEMKNEAASVLSSIGSGVNILVERMHRCPTLAEVSDAICTKMLMSGMVDIKDLLRHATHVKE